MALAIGSEGFGFSCCNPVDKEKFPGFYISPPLALCLSLPLPLSLYLCISLSLPPFLPLPSLFPPPPLLVIAILARAKPTLLAPCRRTAPLWRCRNSPCACWSGSGSGCRRKPSSREHRSTARRRCQRDHEANGERKWPFWPHTPTASRTWKKKKGDGHTANWSNPTMVHSSHVKSEPEPSYNDINKR